MMLLKKLLLTIICTPLLFVQAQTVSLTKERQLFDFGWKFQLGDSPAAKTAGFDDATWRQLDLPHDWSIEGTLNAKEPMGNDGGYFPAGIGWYRKTFELASIPPQKKLFLYFEGVYMNAEVYINGQLLGKRPYGYSTFYYDISPYLTKGKNTVAVRVDNAQQKNCRWYSGSGIYRHVWLLAENALHIQPWATQVTTPVADAKKATVQLQTTISNQTAAAQSINVEIRLLDKTKKTVAVKSQQLQLAANANQALVQEFTIANPALWDIATPSLYEAKITITAGGKVVDNQSTSFGIRTIAYNPEQGFLLNGKSIKINGGCVHHDNGALGAAAYDRAEYKKVELLKAGGFNTVRTSHNPPSEAFLRACDELGLLVVDESFDGWREEKNKYDYAMYFDEWWQKDIEAMVLRDRNHPSIVMWSIGNEIIERKKAEAITTGRNLAMLVHQLDASRPVTSAMTTWDKDWEIFDSLFAVHDIAGYNYQMHHAEADHQRVPSRVIVQTESYPNDAFKNWKAVQNHKYIIGDIVWTAMDYLGESGIGRSFYAGETPGNHWERDMYPWHGAYCGDIDFIGWRKPISHYRDLLYNEDKKLYMAVKEPSHYYGDIKLTSWSVWPTWESWSWPKHEGKDIEVEVYSRYDAVKLYLNNQLIGEKSTGVETEFKAVFKILYVPGTLKAVGVQNGKEVATSILQTAGEASKIKLHTDRSQIAADGQDLSYITVALTDSKGVQQPNADNELSFTIEGTGSIVAVSNANLQDTASYVGHTRKAWKGQAQVIIKSKRQAGNITLTVKSLQGNIPPARVVIKTK